MTSHVCPTLTHGPCLLFVFSFWVESINEIIRISKVKSSKLLIDCATIAGLTRDFEPSGLNSSYDLGYELRL